MAQPEYFLYDHPLSSWCDRVRFVLHFKNIPYTKQDFDLSKKPPELFQGSPQGTIPVLRVTRPDRVVYLGESFQICKYLQGQHPHPSLYPLNEDGTVDVLLENLIDLQFNKLQAKVLEGFYGTFKGTEGSVEKLKIALREANELLAEHQYLMTKFTGRDELTMADVLFCNLVQRIYLLKD